MDYTPPPITNYPPQKSASNRTVIIIVIAVLVFFVFVAGIVGCVECFSGTSSASSASVTLPSEDYVGVLHIEGTIAATTSTSLLYGTDGTYNHEYILTAIESMKNDNYNHGILLYIDTPGGEIYATDEVYTALMHYKEATGRPVYAYFATYACSGGYYLAMAADEIYAHRMSTTGSIGVSYGTHIDLSGLCEKLGIKTEEIVSGDNKAMGSYFAPLTDEQRAIYESQLDEYLGYFVDVVEEGREMTEAEVKALADGRTYTAKQALENGLIDGISEYGAYTDKLTETFGADIAFYDIEYIVEYTDLLASLGYSAEDAIPASEINAVIAALKPLSGVLAYYSGQ